jgi:hypothetical protein
MLEATIDSTECGQQSWPSIVTPLQQLFSMLVSQLPQLLADRRNGVVLFVYRERLAGDELPLLGTKQKHQPHHHRERGLIKLFGRHIRQQLAPKVLIGPIQRMNEHFDRSPHLVAKLVCDFLLVRGAFGEQRFESLVVGHIEEPTG